MSSNKLKPLGRLDVFLSYSRADAQAVSAVRARLSEAGITSFLDRTGLPSGQPWQPFLEKELGRSSAVAVFVGHRMGSWQHREVQVALDRQAREHDFPVIPILLPGLDDEPKGSFLALQTWIDLRADIHDPEQLQNLIAAIHRKAPEGAAPIKAAICPYRGLLPFREEDAAFFFGRDDWIEDLTAKVRAHPLIAVVGRSGSGKSSLVYAGLFPALRRSPGYAWDMLAIRPGQEPLNALAEALSPPPEGATPAERIERINADANRLRRGTVRLDQLVRHHLDQQPGTDRLLLCVDQWEELYTFAARAEGHSKAGNDEKVEGDNAGVAEQTTKNHGADVTRFIGLLLAAAGALNSPLTVVLTVRADFYDHLLRNPTLAAAIQGQQVNLGPMTRAQLQQCIEGPAAAVGLGFEGTLVKSILDDVGEEEGKLPLLEYALRETWEASRKAWQNGGTPGLLTFAAYNAIGRVGGAIGTRAEQIYERLGDAQRQAARRLFVSLVAPGEGQEYTRARAAVPDEPAMAVVVRQFSDPAARLVVTSWDQGRGERVAEVSHEALIRNWGTLRSWIEANREVLRTRERIRGQMKHWEQQKEPDDLLLQRGRALEEGRQLLTSHGDVLIDDIRRYVERSIEHEERLIEAEQRQREEAQRAELERERRLRHAQELAARQAQAAERKALAQESRALAALAQSETRAGNAVNGMLLALRGMPVAGVEDSRPVVTENRQALVDAILAQRELLVMGGHEGPVVAVAFSPDGTRIVSGAYCDQAVRVWDAASGAELKVLRGHEEWVWTAAFSPDGARIVTGSDDKTVRMWDAASGAELMVLRGHEGRVEAAAFSPDGARIVTGSGDKTVRVWDAASGAELMVLRGHREWVETAAFSPDGTRIVSGSHDHTVRVWDAASGVELAILRGREAPVEAAAFSPDGAHVVSASGDKTVRVWDVASGAELLVLRGHEGAVVAAAFSPDGTRIVSGSDDGTLRVWDATSGAELLVLRGHEGKVNAAAFSADGTRIVSGSDDGTVRVWGATRGADLKFLHGHEGTIVAVALSRDGARIVSASDDQTVRAWDAATGAELMLLHGCVRGPAAFSPDGTRIVSGSDDQTVRVWDAATGAELLVLRGHGAEVRAVAFSADGTRIVSGSVDRTVRVWDATSGAELMVLRGHEGAVAAAGFSPDGARIVSGAYFDQTVRVWDAASGAGLLVLRGHKGAVEAAAFSPDGARIVSGAYDQTVRVWDAGTGVELLVLRGHEHFVNAAEFSPDGARIVSGSVDRTVRVWDAARGVELLVLRGHEQSVDAAAFSPDGARIVSGSSDGAVRVWFVGQDDGALVAHACERLPRDLSPKAMARFNLDATAPWPCAERARTLWPHGVDLAAIARTLWPYLVVDAAAIAPAAGPAKDGGTAAR